jgi:uncharacterized SAM-binding protein YcdF (DUF218 family)
MIISAVITAVLVLLLALFVAPFFHRIVNLGNVVGTVVSAILLAAFIFRKPLTGKIAEWWKYPAGKTVLLIVAGFSAVCILLAAFITVFMIRAANNSPDGQPTTLVVLGCQVRDGRPSLMLRRRLDTAYDYLSEYEDVKVIVSGGKGDDEAISEAQCMKDYLVSCGITEDRIIMEDCSSSTRENLAFSKKIIENNGLEEKITIVTDGYHQLRATMIAENLGIEPYNISAHTSYWLVPTYWVREWFGVLYQFVSVRT